MSKSSMLEVMAIEILLQRQQIKLLEKLAVELAKDEPLKLCPYCREKNCDKPAGTAECKFKIFKGAK